MMSLHPFQKRVQENRANGMDSVTAVRKAMEADPAAHASWLEEVNERNGRTVNLPGSGPDRKYVK